MCVCVRLNLRAWELVKRRVELSIKRKESLDLRDLGDHSMNATSGCDDGMLVQLAGG